MVKGADIAIAPSELLVGRRPWRIKDPKQGRDDCQGQVISPPAPGELLKAGVKAVSVERNLLDGAVLLQEWSNMNTGEVLLEAKRRLRADPPEMSVPQREEFTVCFPTTTPRQVFSETLSKDHTRLREGRQSCSEDRPGEPHPGEQPQAAPGHVLDNQKYDLSRSAGTR